MRSQCLVDFWALLSVFFFNLNEFTWFTVSMKLLSRYTFWCWWKAPRWLYCVLYQPIETKYTQISYQNTEWAMSCIFIWILSVLPLSISFFFLSLSIYRSLFALFVILHFNVDRMISVQLCSVHCIYYYCPCDIHYFFLSEGEQIRKEIDRYVECLKRTDIVCNWVKYGR